MSSCPLCDRPAAHLTPSPDQMWPRTRPSLSSRQTLTPNEGRQQRGGGTDATRPSTGPSSVPRTRAPRGRRPRAHWSWASWRGRGGGRSGGGGTRACWASLCAGRWAWRKSAVWGRWVRNHGGGWRMTWRSVGGWWRRRFLGRTETSLCSSTPNAVRGRRRCWTATGRRRVLAIDSISFILQILHTNIYLTNTPITALLLMLMS